LPDTGSVRRGLDAHLDAGLADGDAVVVLEGYAGILVLGSLFRGFAFFAPAALFPVHMRAVHAAEIAWGSLVGTGFEQEVVAGDAIVVGKAEKAVRHPPEQEGIVPGVRWLLRCRRVVGLGGGRWRARLLVRGYLLLGKS